MPNAIFQHTEEHRVSANLSSCSQYFNSVQHCHTVVKVMGSGSGWGSAPTSAPPQFWAPPPAYDLPHKVEMCDGCAICRLIECSCYKPIRRCDWLYQKQPCVGGHHQRIALTTKHQMRIVWRLSSMSIWQTRKANSLLVVRYALTCIKNYWKNIVTIIGDVLQ